MKHKKNEINNYGILRFGIRYPNRTHINIKKASEMQEKFFQKHINKRGGNGLNSSVLKAFRIVNIHRSQFL